MTIVITLVRPVVGPIDYHRTEESNWVYYLPNHKSAIVVLSEKIEKELNRIYAEKLNE